jgi:murein L,D-transpeptidase YcbB/YkuD
VRGVAPTPQARQVIALLSDADAKGLDPADYDAPLWEARLFALARGGEEEAARFDGALVSALSRYAADLHHGRVDPRSVGLDLEVAKEPLDVPSLVVEAACAPDPGAVLARVEPPHRGYRRLLAALGDLRELARACLLHAIPVDLDRAIRSMTLTLERWRWAPSRFDVPPIVVNIPEFRLRAYDASGDVALSSEVVVGRAYRSQTPVFTGLMRTVIFHPYWNVPVGITRRELLRDVAKAPGALVKGGYEIVTGAGRVAAGAAGPLPESTKQALRSGTLLLRQRPGTKNALGNVKFVFPNEHDVYLHDTPARRLFARARRDFCHGCIRVRAAEELAFHVLRGDPRFAAGGVRGAFETPKTEEVRLPRPIPVLIVYGTAVADENGGVRFFADIYGHDEALDRALRSRLPGAGRGAR